MIKRVLTAAPRNRSGRVIGVVRLLLALTFIAVLWIDPDQPIRHPAIGDWMLAAYVAYSAVILAIVWESWWWDSVLSLPTQLIDVAVFLIALFFTEDESSNFTSPYIGFFMFLVFSAMVRWDWRTVFRLIPILAALYFADALLLRALGIDVDLGRMTRRTVYMILIPTLFVWFAANRGRAHVGHFAPTAERASPSELLIDALHFSASELHAQRAAVVWADPEEPWLELIEWAGGHVTKRRLSVEDDRFVEAAPSNDGAFLFSLLPPRVLLFSDDGRRLERISTVECELAKVVALNQGVSFPIRTSHLVGRLVIGGVDGLCSDDLRTASLIQSQIESALDRNFIQVVQERENAQLQREALARDLHDGVAQSLAGAALRLEGLRVMLQTGDGDPLAEIDDAKIALRSEQENVRRLIARLKEDNTSPHINWGHDVREWLSSIARAWRVEVNFHQFIEDIRFSPDMDHEIRHIMRESIANAVRHGRAGIIDVSIHNDDGRILMTIDDNGLGFPKNNTKMPWSISERVKNMGQMLEIGSSVLGGARICLTLPQRQVA